MKKIFILFLILFSINFTYSASTEILSVPATLTAGTYHITSDLSTNSDGFTLTGDGIFLDCRGHKITGDGGGGDYGIYTGNTRHGIVENCIFENFDRGLSYISYSNGTLKNITLINNKNYGFWTGGDDGGNYTDIFIYNTSGVGQGIYFNNMDNSYFENIHSENGTIGINIGGFSNNNVIKNMNLSGNSNYDFKSTSSTNSFTDLYISDQAYDTIYTSSYTNVTQANKVLTTGNLLVDSGEYTLANNITTTTNGFILVNSDISFDCQGHTITGDLGPDYGIRRYANSINNFTLKNCNINNFARGLEVYAITDGLITNSNFSNNAMGLYLFNSNNITYDNLIIKNSNDVGIRFQTSNSFNTIKNSQFINNNNYDIYRNNVLTSNVFYLNYFSNSSKFTSLTASNYLDLTVGSNYLGNWWTDPSACTDPTINKSFSYGGYYYTVCDSNSYSAGGLSDRGVILAKTTTPNPYYIFPTPNTNIKTSKTNLTINMSYNGNTITNCEINLDNGSTIIMEDQTTYCQGNIIIAEQNKKEFTYYVSYTQGAETNSLETRTFTYFPTSIENSVFPSLGLGSIIIALIFFIIYI